MAVVSLAGPLWTERHNIAQCQDLNEAQWSMIYPIKPHLFLISNFHRVLNVIFFLLGDAGIWILCADVLEHSVCSIFTGHVNKKKNWDEIPRHVPVILLVHTTY